MQNTPKNLPPVQSDSQQSEPFQHAVMARFDRIESEASGLRKEMVQRFERNEADIITLKTDVAVIKTDISGLKGDVSELKTDVSELKVDVSSLKGDNLEIRSELKALWRNAQEMREDQSEFRREVSGEFRELRRNMRADFRLMFAALISVAIGLTGIMAKGFHWL